MGTRHKWWQQLWKDYTTRIDNTIHKVYLHKNTRKEGTRNICIVMASSTQVSPELISQCIKGGNAYAIRSRNNVWFSKEKGNLYSKHNIKYSGLANGSTIDIAAEGEGFQTTVTTTSGLSRKVKAGKSSTKTLKQDFRGMSKSIVKTAKAGRKDLTNDALRRLAAVHKSRRVIKASQ